MRTSFFILFTSALALAACQPKPSNTVSNLVSGQCYSGANIYTALDASPRINAVAVKDGVITYAGNSTDKDWCMIHAGDNPKLVELGENGMYPGFTDAHGHFIGIGLRELTLNLEGTESVTDLRNKLKSAVKEAEPDATLYGRGWIETHWPEGRFPNRGDLDDIAPSIPLILERADGHAVVVNSAALQAAGITRDTKSPFGGDILKDQAGEPTGMLIDKASNLVADLMPVNDDLRIQIAMKKASDLYASRGWTNIHSMSFDPKAVDMIKTASMSNDVNIRVYASTDIGNGFITSDFAQNQDSKNLITRRSIKLYSDGALGSRGAALLAPYDDDPDNIGLMLTTYETIMPVLHTALRDGIQVNTHAIGDKANKLVLDWYEEAFATIPASERAVADPRWRIEHSQILDIEDIPRFAQLGVIPSMQPSHAIGDLHFAVDRIGPTRLAGGYAWRSLIDSGSIIAGGTDAPVEVGDPRIEFYAAINRKDLKGYSNENWYPSEKVTRQEALKMFTAWPAYAAFEENRLGTIEVGKAADFTIFDRDIMTIPAPEILNAQTIMTIVNGVPVFKSE